MEIPKEFGERMIELLGEEEYRRFENSLGEEPSVSVRFNLGKRKAPSAPVEGSVEVPWCAGAWYLPKRPAFTFDPSFHAGCYYVQEASSMYLARVLSEYVTRPSAVLDLCAAPGGKSTLTLDNLPEGSFLVANEVVRQRASVLRENIIKWGNPCSMVTSNQAADFRRLGCVFDVVIADVPCSGEGMFRKDEDSIKEWSLDNVRMCAARQRDIIADIWPCIKPGGLLVYSTCTYNVEEDEANVNWIRSRFDATPLRLHFDGMPPVKGSLSADCDADVCHFMPHVSRGEGFFIAAFRKGEEGGDELPAVSSAAAKKPRKQAKAEPPVPAEVKRWLNPSSGFVYISCGDSVCAVPSAWQSLTAGCMSCLNVLHAGVTLARRKGKDLVPDVSLALSTATDRGVFAEEEADYATALSYLRGECLRLSPSVPKGFVLLTYGGSPLGFVKNLGSRANNLYPQEWKIRSSHTPEDVVLL